MEEMVEETQPEASETEIATEKGEEKQYYTVKQIAIKFHYTAAWVSYLCKIGRIKATKPFGRDWRIPIEEYNKIVKEGLPSMAKKEPTPPTRIINAPAEEVKKNEPKSTEEEKQKPERYFPFNLLFRD